MKRVEVAAKFVGIVALCLLIGAMFIGLQKDVSPTLVFAADNTPPVLSGGGVSPLTGTAETTFTYSVIYEDADNDPPTPIIVIIDGNPLHPMTKVGAGAYSAGVRYEYSTTGLEKDISHSFQFAANDGKVDATGDISLHTGPTVGNSLPKLSSGTVSPTTGYTTTTFTYSVTYADDDNDPPTSITVSVDGGDHPMTKVGAGAYTAGVQYRYSTSGLEKDISHSFQFAANDGTVDATGDTSLHTGPTVENSRPVANAGPDKVGLVGEWVTLDGGDSWDPDPDDSLVDYKWEQTAGVEITEYAQPVKLPLVTLKFKPPQVDEYTFSLKVYDGTTWSLPDTVGITVKAWNRAPLLSDGGVYPTTGDEDTEFTFYVIYTDDDGDPPMSITVSIGGRAPEVMTPREGELEDYTKGVEYECSIGGLYDDSDTGLPWGTHWFQFAASDGIDDAIGDIDRHHGPTVSRPATPTPTPPPPQLEVDLMGTLASGSISEAGVLGETIEATTADGGVTLRLPGGTKVLDIEGNPLEEIRLDLVSELPDPPGGAYIIGLACDLGPEGATFDPSIGLTIAYDPTELPEGVNEEDLVIAYYDSDTGHWVQLPSVVDTGAHTVTASISHSTNFAIIGRTGPALTFAALSISPSTVHPGESVTISAQVTNSGGVEGSYIVTLLIEGEEEATQEITLAPGASDTTTFTVTRDTAGTYAVEIGGLTGEFAVVAPFPWALVGGIIGGVLGILGLLVAAAIAVYLVVFRRGKAAAQEDGDLKSQPG